MPHQASPCLTKPHQASPRQGELDLSQRDRWIERLTEHSRAVGLLDTDLLLLRAVAESDQQLGDQSIAVKTKRAWGSAIGRDPNTAIAAMRRLSAAGVAASESTPRGYAVLVDWQAVRDLPEMDVGERLRRSLAASGEGLVRLGEASPTCSCKEHVYKTRVPCSVSLNVEPVMPSAGAAEVSPEAVEPCPPTGLPLPTRPWSRDRGLAGDDLLAAWRARDKQVLSGLYWAGVEAGWWGDCEAYRITFLSCVAHACGHATTNPMALLVQFVKANLRDRATDSDEQRRRYRLTANDEDWAIATRRAWQRAKMDSHTIAQEATNYGRATT